MLSAIVGPVWHFLDPFSTLHDLLRRAGPPARHPARGTWPTYPAASVAGRPSSASSSSSGWSSSSMPARSMLFIVLVGYTALTLAMMAQFGRDEWRSQGDVFTVWFRLLGRLALLAPRRRGRAASPADRSPAACWSPAAAWPTSSSSPSASARSCSTGCHRPSSGSTCSALPGLAPTTAAAGRVPRASSSSPPSCVTRIVGVAATGRRPAADRRRLPDRPLPDVPPDRRAAHRHRDLRPVPARLGPVRLRLPRADRRVAATRSRLDDPARGGRRRPHARGVGRARGRHARRAGRPERQRRSATARSRSRSSWSR